MKRVHIVTVAVSLVVITGLLLWLSRSFLMQNNVIFLLNQKEFAQADAVLQKLENNAPENLRTQFLQAKTFTLTGNFHRAVETSLSEDLTAAYPETLYWRALAEYLLGKDTEAALTSRKFQRYKLRLSASSSGDISKTLAGDSSILQLPDSEGSFRTLFPVEQAVYTGLAASQQMDIGHLDVAARLFRDAFMLDNRNPKLLYQACKVNALIGYVDDAQMFIDYSNSQSMQPMLEDFEKSYKEYRNSSLTLRSDDFEQGSRKIDIARALAWSANVFLKQNPQENAVRVSAILEELVKEYPYDVVLQVRKAIMLNLSGKPKAAVAVYENLQNKFPNFTVLFKLAGAEGISEDELSARVDLFMKNLHSVTSIPLTSFSSDKCVMNPAGIEFKPGGSVTAKVSVKERGSYTVMMVGRGVEARRMWPLVKVFVNNKFAGVTYVCREKWDCYTLTVPLESGAHDIGLVYEGDIIDGNDNDSTRPFSLRALYVALTGVADVR